MNIDYLIAEKWSGQNWTSRTGSAAPVVVKHMIATVIYMYKPEHLFLVKTFNVQVLLLCTVVLMAKGVVPHILIG